MAPPGAMLGAPRKLPVSIATRQIPGKSGGGGGVSGFCFLFWFVFSEKKSKKIPKKNSKKKFQKKRAKRPDLHQRLSPGNPAQAISGPYPQWLARNRAPSSKAIIDPP